MNDPQYYYCNERCNTHAFYVYCVRGSFTGADFSYINPIGHY